MRNKVRYIYALCEPDGKTIRYIGHSHNPEKRLKQHLWACNLKYKTHKNDWIKSLLKNNEKPTLKIIEKTNISLCAKREIYWINKLKNDGYNLTNGTEGGEGQSNPTQEFRDNMKNNINSQGIKKSYAETSEYVCVCYDKKRNKWIYVIQRNYKIYRGRKNTEIEAALEYNRLAKILYGKDAKLNIIKQGES